MKELETIAYQIEPSDFPHEIGFIGSVDPAICTVRIESDQLTLADMRALIERFGTALSFDTTEVNHPDRLEG